MADKEKETEQTTDDAAPEATQRNQPPDEEILDIELDEEELKNIRGGAGWWQP
jgi:hypothetical protein